MVDSESKTSRFGKEGFCWMWHRHTAEGKRHLGAAIGSPTFVKHYVSEKVDY